VQQAAAQEELDPINQIGFTPAPPGLPSCSALARLEIDGAGTSSVAATGAML